MEFITKIKRTENESIIFTWDSGEEYEISLKTLRDECPCVSCKGESVIFNNYIPIKSPYKPTGFYKIDKIEPVGNYAVQIIWKDGHKTGIYSWDSLMDICEVSREQNS